ncbi:MAG: hypothetical protein KGZ40_02315 [Clostridiales bacterium]|nr:hypothetical protein [Clostridiales bacterium]
MKRIGVVSTLLLVALLTVGLGLARWTDSVNIDGTVHTGSLSAGIDDVMCSDSEITGKNYSEITAVVDPDDPKTLWVTVRNGYPSITYTCEFALLNTGTIPLHVDAVTVSQLPAYMDVDVTGLPAETQVHPGGSAPGTLTVHFDNEAEELATYTFSVEVDVGQWNLPPE